MTNYTRKTSVVGISLIIALHFLTACSVQMQPAAVLPNLGKPTSAEAAAIKQTTTPTVEIVPTATSQIPVESLKNATYSGIYDEPAILTDGKFEKTLEGQLYTVEYVDSTERYTDLDGDGVKDAIVFLVERGGGTAAFTYIAAQLNHNGQPVDAGAAVVEDRTQVRSMAIQGGQVVLEITTRGPGDGDCCPSYKTRKTYTLKADRLVEIPGGDQDLVKISADDLNGTSWTLLEFDTGKPVLADSEVTISFRENQLSGSGGCNSYSSSFSLGDPNPFIIDIGQIAATKKACPDPLLSQESSYFTALENARLWGYNFGQLILAYPDGQDGGLKLLLFAPQGAP